MFDHTFIAGRRFNIGDMEERIKNHSNIRRVENARILFYKRVSYREFIDN